MLNKFTRTELLLGKDKMNKLQNSKVAVFGIGGVGSYAVEGLVRAGIGKFVLIDNDNICLTNINRQIHATTETVGMSKVEAMKSRILEINPEVEVTIHSTFLNSENADQLVLDDYDYIVDAIDTVTSKLDLIATAKKKNIEIISSMGAGNKLDPTRFEIVDITKTSVCPLAKVMRRELKRRNILTLKTVYSKEEPLKPIDTRNELTKNNNATNQDSNSKHAIRRQVPGSISFVPSVVGLIIASEIVKDLTK